MLNDTVAEGIESFNLVLSALSGATVLDPAGTAQIWENDQTAVAAPRISVDDVTVDESQTYAEFLVHLSAPGSAVVTVNYQAANSTALNGSDYAAQSGTLTFAPGETVKTVRMAVLNDTAAEPPRIFSSR